MDFEDEDVYEKFGLGFEMSWLSDTPSPEFSDVYNEFLKNGCKGSLTKEQAIEKYKSQCGIAPEFVDEWPSIEAISAAREAAMKLGDVPESFLNERYPYEPALKYQY